MRYLLLLVLSFLSLPAFAADRYEFDKSHTRILFYVNHLGFSDMIGEFTLYDGAFTFDPAKPEESTLTMALKPSGIRTSSADLDKDLQGKDFFRSDEFPDITFQSTSVKVTSADTGDVTGNLTMLGVTQPVIVHVRFNKADYHPLTRDFVAGFAASASLYIQLGVFHQCGA